MRTFCTLFLVLTVSAYSCGGSMDIEPMDALIADRLGCAADQYTLMAASLADQPDKLPRTIDANGKLLTTSPSGWVSGFVPGSFWYLYEYTKKQEFLDAARNYTARIEQEKYNRGTHDLGFMLFCSFGNGYRLTGDTAYLNVLFAGAESLASRYNPVVGCIRSWDHNRENWQFPVIIDNMMNLEFLFWIAAQRGGNPDYRNIGTSHANKTIENHFRPDYSSYHVVSYDTITGAVQKKNTAQGNSDESAWARGQSWGLYGFTVMYRITLNRKYLEQAHNIADYLVSHPNLPADKIPYWDYNAPGIPNAKRDASAAAIMASALIELSKYVNAETAKTYLETAETQLRTLSSPEYFAAKGTNGNFILKHSVGHFKANSEVDVPLTYADYYYIEAMLRYNEIIGAKK